MLLKFYPIHYLPDKGRQVMKKDSNYKLTPIKIQ